MNAIRGTWKSGNVQEYTPESIAKWLAEFDAIPPWEFTPEEEARWKTDRAAMKEYTISRTKDRIVADRKEEPP